VYRTTSRRQLKLSYHAKKAANLLDQHLGRPWTKRYTEHVHGRGHRSTKFGDVPDGLLGNGFRLASGLPGLIQGGRVLLSRCPRLLQLGLDL
jgi:hypothetical protein